MAAPSQTSPNQASEATSTAVATVEKDAAPKTPQETSAPPPTTERSETMTPSTPTRTPAAAPKPQNEAAVPSKNSPLKEEEELTYQNTQTSNVVCTAKELLKDGHFDEALDTISQEMSRITSLIGNDEQGSMHECMAPLYYLYGTTLLYSIEESTDNVAAIMNHQNEATKTTKTWMICKLRGKISKRPVTLRSVFLLTTPLLVFQRFKWICPEFIFASAI